MELRSESQTSHRGVTLVELASKLAAVQFNHGMLSFLRPMELMNISVGVYSVRAFRRIDEERKIAMKKQSTKTWKKQRAAWRRKRKRKQEKQVADEGVSYGAGEFGDLQPAKRGRGRVRNRARASSRGRAGSRKKRPGRGRGTNESTASRIGAGRGQKQSGSREEHSDSTESDSETETVVFHATVSRAVEDSDSDATIYSSSEPDLLSDCGDSSKFFDIDY